MPPASNIFHCASEFRGRSSCNAIRFLYWCFLLVCCGSAAFANRALHGIQVGTWARNAICSSPARACRSWPAKDAASAPGIFRRPLVRGANSYRNPRSTFAVAPGKKNGRRGLLRGVGRSQVECSRQLSRGGGSTLLDRRGCQRPARFGQRFSKGNRAATRRIRSSSSIFAERRSSCCSSAPPAHQPSECR